MGECSDLHTWGMIDIFFLKSWSPISVVKILSIQILPSGSDNLKRAEMRELFPAPVLPTMPTCNEIQERLRKNTTRPRPRRSLGCCRELRTFFTQPSSSFSTSTLLLFQARQLLVGYMWGPFWALLGVCQSPSVLAARCQQHPQTVTTKTVTPWQMSLGWGLGGRPPG